MPGRIHSILYTLPAAAVSSEVVAGLASSALKQRKPGLMTGSLRHFLPAPRGDFAAKRYHRSRSCFWNLSSCHDVNGQLLFLSQQWSLFILNRAL